MMHMEIAGSRNGGECTHVPIDCNTVRSYIQTFVHACVRKYACVDMDACTYVRLRVCTNVCVCTYVRMYVQLYVCYAYACVCVRHIGTSSWISGKGGSGKGGSGNHGTNSAPHRMPRRMLRVTFRHVTSRCHGVTVRFRLSQLRVVRDPLSGRKC